MDNMHLQWNHISDKYDSTYSLLGVLTIICVLFAPATLFLFEDTLVTTVIGIALGAALLTLGACVHFRKLRNAFLIKYAAEIGDLPLTTVYMENWLEARIDRHDNYKLTAKVADANGDIRTVRAATKIPNDCEKSYLQYRQLGNSFFTDDVLESTPIAYITPSDYRRLSK